MGDEMQTYQDANLQPSWVDAPDDLARRSGVSVAWMLIALGLLLFWAAAAVAVVAMV